MRSNMSFFLEIPGESLSGLVADLLPQWIEQELHAFPPCKLCRRHKIAVTRHENQRIDLMLEGHAGDIQANTHIHSFLTKPEVHVSLTNFSPRRNELLQFACTGFTESGRTLSLLECRFDVRHPLSDLQHLSRESR